VKEPGAYRACAYDVVDSEQRFRAAYDEHVRAVAAFALAG
jgi:hypothetical protein